MHIYTILIAVFVLFVLFAFSLRFDFFRKFYRGWTESWGLITSDSKFGDAVDQYEDSLKKDK